MSVAFKLEPFDINELKNMKKRICSGRGVRRDVCSIIEEFAESEHDCCKVCSCDSDRKAHVEVTILRRSVEIAGYKKEIKVILRGEDVYLVKKNKWEK